MSTKKHDPENRECPWYFDNHKHQNGKGCSCPEREEEGKCQTCGGYKDSHERKGRNRDCAYNPPPSSEPKVCPECQFETSADYLRTMGEENHTETCSKYVQKDWGKGPSASVTGDEWVEEKVHEFVMQLHKAGINGSIEAPMLSFARSLLLAQRTHIKQALLGRYQEQKKEARHIHNWSSSQVDKKAYCDGIDEAKLIVNEELA